MDDSAGGGEGGALAPVRLAIIDGWLEPLSGAACGEDLEYDDEFREMEKAAAGRAPTQFDPEGVQPDWRTAMGHAQSLFERTRDLRVALFWTRAKVHLDGVQYVTEGLRLMEGLLSRFWDELHPLPDDGDAYARVNALNELSSLSGLAGDIRESLVLSDRSIGELKGRDIEIALGTLEPRNDDTVYSRSSVEQMLGEGVRSKPALGAFPPVALEKVGELQALMRERVGYAAAPEFGPIVSTLTGIRDVMPGAAPAEASASGEGGGESSGGESDAPRKGGSGRASLSGSIESRVDALRAIDMICDYLERTEPTNPAQLLLRRARKLVNKNFVELVREFAPESLTEVARVMGLSAEELSALQGQE